MAKRKTDPTFDITLAGLAAWLIPGAGHWLAGQRAFAVVFFVAITFPYLVGVALGGVKYSINAKENVWVFLAEMGVGGYTLAGALISNAITVDPAKPGEYRAFYPGSDVSQIYLITAGLLNLLAVLDAMSRVHYNQPTVPVDAGPLEELRGAAERLRHPLTPDAPGSTEGRS